MTRNKTQPESQIAPHIAVLISSPHLKPVHQGDVTQELLTRLAPLPLTSLGVREVSLAQPEEAEGLGSVEVVLKITSMLMIMMIIMMVMKIMMMVMIIMMMMKIMMIMRRTKAEMMMSTKRGMSSKRKRGLKEEKEGCTARPVCTSALLLYQSNDDGNDDDGQDGEDDDGGGMFSSCLQICE